MATRPSITFDAIAEMNAARLEHMGVSADNQTVEAALVQMIAALGELATLSYRHSASLSPFEKEETSLVLGRITVALSTIGVCLDVDVGAAALRILGERPSRPYARGMGGSNPPERSQQQQHRHHSAPQAVRTNGDAAVPSPHPLPPSAAAGLPPQTRPHGGLTVPPQAAVQAPLMLSPTSRDSFFTYLDRLAGDTKEAIEKADLRWVVPGENGVLEDLIANGARAPVSYDLFPLYYGMVQDRRRTQDRVTGVAPEAASAQPVTVAVPGYDPVREAQMFSPTHFSNGLFSPRADAGPAELLHAQVRPPTFTMPRASRAASAEVGHYERSNTAVAASAGYPVSAARSASPSQPRPPMSSDDFDATVERLRTGAVAGPQIAQLGLTFCFPQGDRVVELVPDGLQIMVTAANCREFLRMLDDARRSARLPSAERIHRMDSVRRLQPMVAPPETDAAAFSPSHFSHGLFAPYEDKTTFYVDYDATERTLPPFLRLKAQQQQQQGQQQRQQPTAAGAGGHAPHSEAGAESAYMTAVRACDYTTLNRIIAEIRVSAGALAFYGVTFCVPSALEPSSTPAEKATGVHELFPGSSTRLVEPADQAIFLSLVQRYFPPPASS